MDSDVWNERLHYQASGIVRLVSWGKLIPISRESPKYEPEIIFEGVPVPLGETDLEPVGVEVDANRDETEALEFRYGSVDIGMPSIVCRGNLGALAASMKRSPGGRRLEGGRMAERCHEDQRLIFRGIERCCVAQWPETCAATCELLQSGLLGRMQVGGWSQDLAW